MTGEENQSTERRVSKLETEIGQIVRIQHEQGEHIASMMNAVETQTKQIGSLLHATKPQPTPWGVIFTGIGVLVMGISLALVPLYRTQDKDASFHVEEIHHRIDSAELMARNTNDIKWLGKMEERLNNRIHARIGNGYKPSN